MEKARDTTSAANIRSAYAQAQAAYLTEDAGGNPDITVNKTDGKVTSVVVQHVKFEGTQAGWSGAIKNLPNGVDWSDLGADADGDNGGSAGDKTLTFTYADDGTIECTVA